MRSETFDNDACQAVHCQRKHDTGHQYQFVAVARMICTVVS